MASSLNTVQQECKDICDIYTRLTSLLIEYGYEVFVDRMNSMDEIECLESTMFVLDLMDDIMEEAQNISIPVIDGGLNDSPRTEVRINKQTLKDMIKESLESSIKEHKTPKRTMMNYKDTIDELEAGLRGLLPGNMPQSPKFSNQRMMELNKQAKTWRERNFRDSDVRRTLPAWEIKKDTLDEIEKAFRAQQPRNMTESPKFSNQRMMELNQQAKAWRERNFRDSDVRRTLPAWEIKKDTLDEIEEAFRAQQPRNMTETPKFSNQRMMELANKAKAWRDKNFRDSDVRRKITPWEIKKDTLDEIEAAFRTQQPRNVHQSPKFSNERMLELNKQAKAWRDKNFRDSDVGKKWKPQQQNQINYFYDDDAPSTSARHNTSINVENLNLEI